MDNTGGASNRFHLPHPWETDFVGVTGTHMLPIVYIGPAWVCTRRPARYSLESRGVVLREHTFGTKTRRQNIA